MKLTVKNTRKKHVKIFDMHGVMIPGVVSFNTKTGAVELLLLGKLLADKSARVVRSKKNTRAGSFIKRKDGGLDINSEAVIIKAKIKGSYATINGKRIK